MHDFGVTMKQLRKIVLITFVTTILPAIAHANMGPAVVLQFGFHLVFLTWIIGLGEGLLLCTLFRAWRPRVWMFRIFFSMIAANVTSAWLGMLFVKSRYAAQIMGDVTIENLIPAHWTMVYITFVLTIIIEFPFFLMALYGRKWLILKAVITTVFVHFISYSFLFFFYTSEESINMVTELEVVPTSAFEMKEEYDLYYISPDGKNVLRSDFAGNDVEVVTTLDEMDGIPDRLCASLRIITKEISEGKDKGRNKTTQSICWKSVFDLYVLMNVNGANETKLLLKDFSSHSAVGKNKYSTSCDVETANDFGYFRSFSNVKSWEFYSDYWSLLSATRIKQGYQPYTTRRYRLGSNVDYRLDTPFVQWPVRNGTHIAGDYGVFLLGKDQICILDPEKKRIALIARGFGPVVAKPPLEEIPETISEQTVNEVP